MADVEVDPEQGHDHVAQKGGHGVDTLHRGGCGWTLGRFEGEDA